MSQKIQNDTFDAIAVGKTFTHRSNNIDSIADNSRACSSNQENTTPK